MLQVQHGACEVWGPSSGRARGCLRWSPPRMSLLLWCSGSCSGACGNALRSHSCSSCRRAPQAGRVAAEAVATSFRHELHPVRGGQHVATSADPVDLLSSAAVLQRCTEAKTGSHSPSACGRSRGWSTGSWYRAWPAPVEDGEEVPSHGFSHVGGRGGSTGTLLLPQRCHRVTQQGVAEHRG